MTTRTLSRWLLPFFAAGVVGCGGGTPPTQPATLAPVILPPVTDDLRTLETTRTPTPPTLPAKPPAGPPVVFPADTGGRAVAGALVVPPPLAAEAPAAMKPVPYSSAIDRGELPLPVVTAKPFGPVEPKASTARPSPPVEKQLPTTADTTLPEGGSSNRPPSKVDAPPNARAADVPMSAWRQGDRAPLEDPTADLSAGQVIQTTLPVNAGTLPFLRMTIPNPFELSEQLKGKLGKETELGTGPMR